MHARIWVVSLSCALAGCSSDPVTHARWALATEYASWRCAGASYDDCQPCCLDHHGGGSAYSQAGGCECLSPAYTP
jgi:hypothetical protein